MDGLGAAAVTTTDLSKYAYRPEDEWTDEKDRLCRLVAEFWISCYGGADRDLNVAEKSNPAKFDNFMANAADFMDHIAYRGFSIVKTHEADPTLGFGSDAE
jgi:hypothetical protein